MKKNHDGKDDTGKLRWDLLPVEPLEDLVEVITYGSQKYGPNNWQAVPNGKDRYYAAAMRHIMAWRAGDKRDEESGLLHLSHAMCCLVFLSWLDGD